MPGLHGRRDFLHMGMKSVFGSWLGATTLMTSCRGGSSGAVGVEASPLTAARASCLGGRDADAVVVVSSMAALGTAVNAAPPGRNILVAPGTYTGGTLTFNRDGTEANPIIIRPQNGLGTVTINNADWTLANSPTWLVIEKLYFGASRVILTGDHNRISRCRFRNLKAETIRMETARDCRIDHCDFSVPNPEPTSASCITMRGGSMYGAGTAARNLIDYCYFHALGTNTIAFNGFSDTTLPAVGNDVARGQSITVDHCLFEDIQMNGEFVVLKVGGMVWRYNTFLNLNGYFQLRSGGHCEFRSNWFENVDATKAWSEDNLWIGNRFIGGEVLWVPCGNGSFEDGISGEVPSNRYEPATNSTFIGNRFGSGRLQLGQYWNNNTNPAAFLPAKSILLEANTRDSGGNAHEFITTFLNPGATNVTVNETTDEEFTPAVKLTAADVGLNAPDPLCA
jgi:hypothetical protein